MTPPRQAPAGDARADHVGPLRAMGSLSGLLLIAAAAVTWGTTGSVSTLLADRNSAGPLLVGLARMVVAAVLLLAAVALTRRWTIHPEDRWRCLVMGLAMAGYQAAFFAAVPLAGIAVVALVAICTAPLLIAVLAVLLLGERLTRRIRTGLALGVAGTALLIAGPPAHGVLPGTATLGALLALGAGAAYAIYAVAAKASVARSAPLPLAAATFTVAAVALVPTLAWIDSPGRQLALGWPWFLYLGGVATAAAYAMYTTGLRRVPVSVAGVLTLLEPLTATGLGLAVFGERLSGAAIVGALLMLGALALVVTDGPARSTPRAAVPHA